MYLVAQAISEGLQAVSDVHVRVPKLCAQARMGSSCGLPFLNFELPTASCCDDCHVSYA